MNLKIDFLSVRLLEQRRRILLKRVFVHIAVATAAAAAAAVGSDSVVLHFSFWRGFCSISEIDGLSLIDSNLIIIEEISIKNN